MAASRHWLLGVRASGLASSSPRLGLQGSIISTSRGAQCSTSRKEVWSSVSPRGGGPVTAGADRSLRWRARQPDASPAPRAALSLAQPPRTVKKEVESRQGALVVCDRAGESPAVSRLHGPDPRQVPLGPRHLSEVGEVLSPELRDTRA